MQPIVREMANLISKGDSFALATVISRTGSTPREVGACMLVRPDGSTLGTVGGGLLEAQVEKLAPKVLLSTLPQVMGFEFSGKDAVGSEAICGGLVEVLIEVWDARDALSKEVVNALSAATTHPQKTWLVTVIPAVSSRTTHTVVLQNGSLVGAPLVGLSSEQIIHLLRPELFETEMGLVLVNPLGLQGTVVIFGAGHVAKTLAEFTSTVGFRTVVLDDRQEFASPLRFPHADQLVVLDSFSHAFNNLEIDEDSYIVILTSGHLHDQEVLKDALRTRAGYIGMIGSRRKVRLIFDELRSLDFSEADLQRVHAPIGLAIEAETPEEIGISIVAELIQVRAQLNRAKG